MLIRIEYESSWRNSFLDPKTSNNEPIPKGGRKFIASSTNLKGRDRDKYFIEREITLNTVMGVLNRLIGDQKKLYQARKDAEYYFKDIEFLVSFNDIPRHISSELIYLRNMSGNTDPSSFTGMIDTNDLMFTSDYSVEFWGILSLDIDELLEFILHGKEISSSIELNPLIISDRFDEIKKLKAFDESAEMSRVLEFLGKKFEGKNYRNNKDLVMPSALYCSALYLQKDRLSKEYNIDSLFTKTKTIKGFSPMGFTRKTFMSHVVTGGEKLSYGSPYITKDFKKLKKVNGTLEITLKINEDKAEELEEYIENAGVSSFYLGKKGLAYVTYIDTREED